MINVFPSFIEMSGLTNLHARFSRVLMVWPDNEELQLTAIGADRPPSLLSIGGFFFL